MVSRVGPLLFIGGFVLLSFVPSFLLVYFSGKNVHYKRRCYLILTLLVPVYVPIIFLFYLYTACLFFHNCHLL